MVEQILSLPQGSAAIHISDDASMELAIYKDNLITLHPIQHTDTFEQIRNKALECLGFELV